MNSRISVFISIIMAMLVVSMDTTIMNTTMPIVAAELGNMQLYPWIFTSYMLVSTVLSPIAGRLSDILGRKKVFASGIVLFLVGSMLCGLSQTMLQLVIFRFVQGIGAGFMLPFPMIIAGDLFTVEKRGKIQAMFTGMWGLAAVLAPLLGALFVEYATWRWIFYINLPICIAAFIMLMPYKEEYKPAKAAIDYIGAMLFMGGIGCMLILTMVPKGFVWYAAAGIVLLVVFVLYEQRHRSPILPIQMVKKRFIAWISISSFLSCAALFGTSSYIPMYLQEQGHSVFMSGVALLGMSVGWMSLSVPAGKWILRFGYRPLLRIGYLILVMSGLTLIGLKEDTSFAYVFIAMILQGLAFGLINTVSIIGAQQLVQPYEKGISTSFQLLSRNIGTAIGVTVMGMFIVNAADFYVGLKHLFIYGFIVSLFAFASAWFIREVSKEAPDAGQASLDLARPSKT